MELFKNSLVAIKQEQLLIILKELLHLQHILNFYKRGNKDLNSPTRKEDMFSAHSNLEKIQKELLELNERAIKLLKVYRDKEDSEYQNFKFILIYGYITQTINNALIIIELIYKKVYQIFEEAQNQYIPKPNLGRRFSNNNLLQALKENFQSLISMLAPNYNNSLLLSWSYRNYFQIEQRQENLLFINDNRYGNYINLPYWYYELPILLPSITHEAVRIAMLQDKNNIKEIKEFIVKKVNKYIAKPDQSRKYIIKEKILNPKNKLIEKVLADVISYSIYKDSYIQSIVHDLFGVGLATQFNIKLKNNPIKQSNTLLDIFHLEIKSWKFNKHRDITIIRLYILLNIAKNNRSIDAIREFIESIIPLKNMRYGISEVYKNHPHYYNDYIEYIEAYRDIVNLFTTIFNKKYKKRKEPVIKSIEKIIDKDKIKIDFNQLWRLRLKKLKKDMVLHKNEFRKILHQKTLKSLNSYIKSLNYKYPGKLGKQDDIGKPFTLTFVKLRKDIECQDKENLCLDEYIKNQFQDYKNSFGIYDLLKIENTLNYQNINDSLDKIISYIKDITKEQNRPKFFESKYSLMQFFPTISGSKLNSSDIDILYNIELDNQLIAKETEKSSQTNLEFAVKEIVDTLIENSSFFHTAYIYKSLGPKDLMVYVKGVDNQDLLKLNTNLTKLISIRRTFTTIATNPKTKADIKPLTNSYYIVSYLRMKLSNNVNIEQKITDAIEQLDPIEQYYIERISIISGVLDIQIIWRGGTKTAIVFKLYDILMRKRLVSDFQTKFNRTIDYTKRVTDESNNN